MKQSRLSMIRGMRKSIREMREICKELKRQHRAYKQFGLIADTMEEILTLDLKLQKLDRKMKRKPRRKQVAEVGPEYEQVNRESRG